MKIKLISFIYILLFSALFLSADEAKTKSVVLFASKHSDYKWNEDIVDGVKSVLNNHDDIYFNIEYIDDKPHTDDKYNELLKTIFEYKKQKDNYDLLICTDEQILNYVLSYGDNNGRTIPVLFCNKNFFPDKVIIRSSFIKEINNDLSIKDNFDLILKLHPECKNIVCITDSTELGDNIRGKIQKTIINYNSTVKFNFLYDISESDLIKKLNNLSKDTVVFYTFFQEDKNNKKFKYSEILDTIVKNTKVPIYGVLDFNMGHGIVGGQLSSGKEQGKIAATEAIKLLNGLNLNELPGTVNTPKKYMFDKRLLKRFQINENLLPDNYILINEEDSFYQKNKFLFWNIIIYFLILLVIIITLIINISGKVKAEKHLISTRNYLRDVIDCMPSILISVDKDLLIKNYNKSALSFTKTQINNIYNRKFTEVFSELKIIKQDIEIVFNNKKPLLNKKIEIQNSSDNDFFNLSIYQLSDQNTEEVVILMDDISEKTRMEELLIQSEKMMSVGGLAAGMAHEINNPLAGILQGVQILELSLQPNIEKNEITAEKCGISLQKINTYFVERNITTIFESIKTSVQRAANIVTNMLSFSKKSSNKKEYVNIAELFDKTIELASNDYQMKKDYNFRKIIFNKFYQSPIKLIKCFPGEIQQVFLNILKNGAQAMAESNEDKNSYIFDITISQSEKETTIEIEDNGPGMDENTKKRLFEPFYTKRKSGKGVGLGLSISYFIINENHSGSLMVDSQIGLGSKFTIILPMEENNE